MRRGRPRYPDLLTPREQEVLGHLRRGLTNREIAAEMGISLAGARYHVSEILSKLGVSSREEAAAWQAETPLQRFGAPAFLMAPLKKLVGMSPFKVAGGAAIGTVSAGLVVLALGVIAMEGREVPDNPEGLGKMVYVDGGDVWTLALPDGVPARLTDDGGNHAPRWSPSGEWVLFEKPVEAGLPRYWVMREDGSAARDLDAAAVRWARDQDALAYLTSNQRQLLGENADGSGSRVLLDANHNDWDSLGGFEWSPNGEWLAITATARGADAFPVDYVGLWAMRFDGSEARELKAEEDTRAGMLVAGWDGTGANVVYSLQPSFSASFMADGLQWELASLEPDAVNPAPNPEIDPPSMVLRYDDFRDLAPDGRMVVARGGYRYATERKTISLVDFRNGISFIDLTPEGFAATSPVWSPDGETIAYTMQPEDRTGDLSSVVEKRIWFMDGNGENQRRLNDIETWQQRPQWSRDGLYILYVRPDDGQVRQTEDPRQASLWLHELASGDETIVLSGLDYYVNTIGLNVGYYGHLDWARIFDWWQP